MTKVVFGRFINTGRQSDVRLIISSSSRGGFALRIEVRYEKKKIFQNFLTPK